MGQVRGEGGLHLTAVEDMELIKTENISATTEFTQTKRIAEVLKERRQGGRPYTYAGDLLLAGQDAGRSLEKPELYLPVPPCTSL